MAYGRRSARTTPLPKDWPAIRARILRRDQSCRWIDQGQPCGSVERLEVDHIGDPEDHTDTNLRALCAPHHHRRSAQQGGQAMAAIRAKRYRQAEPHPGQRN